MKKIIEIESCSECPLPRHVRAGIGCPEMGHHRELCMTGKISDSCPLEDCQKPEKASH